MLPFRQTSSAVNALEQAVQITQPLARWLIRSGIGYTEFTNALKVVFFQQAYEESQRIGQKSTISSLSLLAGLHRKDVNVLYELRNEPRINPINKPSQYPRRSQGIGSPISCPKVFLSKKAKSIFRLWCAPFPTTCIHDLFAMNYNAWVRFALLVIWFIC